MHHGKHFGDSRDRTNTRAHPAPFRSDIGIEKMTAFTKWSNQAYAKCGNSPKGVVGHSKPS